MSLFPVFSTDRIMGLVLKTTSLKYALLNVYLPYEQSTAQCLLDYQSRLNDLTNYIGDGCFDEIVIMGEFHCDPNKGRFLRELRSMANRHSLLCCNVDALPASTYTYISQNQSATCSWLDHIFLL